MAASGCFKPVFFHQTVPLYFQLYEACKIFYNSISPVNEIFNRWKSAIIRNYQDLQSLGERGWNNVYKMVSVCLTLFTWNIVNVGVKV